MLCCDPLPCTHLSRLVPGCRSAADRIPPSPLAASGWQAEPRSDMNSRMSAAHTPQDPPVLETAIYAFTAQGAELGQYLARELRGDLWLPERLFRDLEKPPDGPLIQPMQSLSRTMTRLFHARSRHVFIAATGIAVRAIAPHLQGKQTDPAVAVVDQQGRHCISLVSGHLGGANALARELAALTGGQAVITTATDTAGLPAPDDLGARLGLCAANVPHLKEVNAQLLAGKRPQLYDPEGLLNRAWAGPSPLVDFFSPLATPDDWNPEQPGTWVHWTAAPPKAFGLHPPCLFAGLGCRRGTPCRELIELVRTVFQARHLAPESLAGLASIEAKADEPGLLRAAEQLRVPLTFFTADQLNGVPTPNPSAMVQQHMGVSSVCEAAAILNSGHGRLLVPKTNTRRATLAVAVSWWPDSGPGIRTT